jgi:hypothetical protein
MVKLDQVCFLTENTSLRENTYNVWKRLGKRTPKKPWEISKTTNVYKKPACR